MQAGGFPADLSQTILPANLQLPPSSQGPHGPGAVEMGAPSSPVVTLTATPAGTANGLPSGDAKLRPLPSRTGSVSSSAQLGEASPSSSPLASRSSSNVDPAELRSRAAARLAALKQGGGAASRPDASGSPTGAGGGGYGHNLSASMQVIRPERTESIDGSSPASGKLRSDSDLSGLGAGVGASFSAPPGPHSWAWHSPKAQDTGAPEGMAAKMPGGGWACPVSVSYTEGEQPMQELQRLEGGEGKHVIVSSVQPDSKAWRAGVRPGHALVALNGRTEFNALPGWQVRLLLEAPITIGFDPVPGRPGGPPAVELRYAPAPNSRSLGLPAGKDVLKPDRADDLWVVAEEVVFKPLSADELASEKGRGFLPGACWQPSIIGAPIATVDDHGDDEGLDTIECLRAPRGSARFQSGGDDGLPWLTPVFCPNSRGNGWTPGDERDIYRGITTYPAVQAAGSATP
eukprot:TRINITY_DN29593_c0_g1_i1.p1 TRINITY_DN29593_c0_g1~~TRINITY_DN29593_c0_g1_i1.p1  ORF type:complete len:459 (+),score=69.81 TRINITY_DN29593_c0_g1_i1:101-1477(+)